MTRRPPPGLADVEPEVNAMLERVPRSQIQLKTLQAAKAELEQRGVAAFESIPVGERAAFVRTVQRALPELSAAAIQDVLQTEWSKGIESLLSSLREGPLRDLFVRSASNAVVVAGAPRPAGASSPLGVRLQQTSSEARAPFWHRTTAEGPYGS